jgi:hypothetical protein
VLDRVRAERNRCGRRLGCLHRIGAPDRGYYCNSTTH